MSDKIDAEKQRKIFAKNLNYYMNRAGKNTADLSTDLSYPFSTVSDWVHGKKYPRMDKVQTIADYFGILKSSLTEENAPMFPSNAIQIDFSKYHSIPILGRISAGLPLYADQQIEGYTLTDLNGGAEYFALRVSGDSMNAAGINDGYIIIVRRQEEVESGEIAVVMVGDNDATVKRFYSEKNSVTLMPQSTNQIHHPQIYDTRKTRIKVLGKVVKCEFML